MQAGSTSKAKRKFGAAEWLTLAVLIGVVGACNAYVDRSAPSASSAVQIGQTGHLRNPSGATVALAPTADDLGQAVQALSVKDTLGLEQMSRAGRLQQVASGTQVRVIDGASRLAIGMSQVRLLDGTRTGEAWWVLDSSLVP